MLRKCFLFILLALPFKSHAQSDSVPEQKHNFQTVISYFHESDFIFGNIDLLPLDTNVAGADKANPPMDNHYNYLGTNGSSAQPQIYNFNPGLFTKTPISSFDIYMLEDKDIPSYHTNKRYTEIKYNTGTFKENGISVLHTQNISKYWNAGLYFERMSVKDFMNFSDTYRSRLGLFTWYRSPNSHYAFFVNATWNAIKNDVNGGLTSDSLFENTTVTNVGIKGLAYELTNASAHFRKKKFSASQYYDLGKSITDTSGKVIGRNTILRIHYKISFERNSYTYEDEDPDSGFYQDFYYGTATFDTSHSDEMRHRFALQKPAGAFGKSAFMRNWSQGVFVELQNVKYGQRTDSSWNNVSGGANVVWKKDSLSPSLFAEAAYVFSGIDKDNYSIKARLSSRRYSFGQLSVEATTGISSPDLIYRLYDGNNFKWTNDFDGIKYLSASIQYKLSQYKLSISVSHFEQDNFVYMNQSAFPQQFTGRLKTDRINLQKDFTYRRFHFDNLFIFQSNNNDDVLHIPGFTADNTLYYESYHFNKALKLSTGFRFAYTDSYYADAFNPATAQFYLQDEKKTNGYLRTDLFVNGQIKTAVIYFKLENIFDELTAKSYFLTPHYPMPGRVLRFGLRWRFFD